eukprot:15443308-Alexandrium_andersonii.AAC.1
MRSSSSAACSSSMRIGSQGGCEGTRTRWVRFGRMEAGGRGTGAGAVGLRKQSGTRSGSAGADVGADAAQELTPS